MSSLPTVRPLLLGLGWSPDQPGGLNRYFGDLLRALGDPAAVVIGPARDVPPGTVAVSDHADPLVSRVRAFAGAAARVRTTGVDVVDAHFALYAAWPVCCGALRETPLVVHFQGPWASEATAAGSGSVLATTARRAIERAVYRRAARVVVLSGAFGRLLARDYGVDPWRIVIVQPGIDLERFRPGDADTARAQFGLDPATRVVLAVRRLVPRTGVDMLLDAWSAAGLDDLDATLVVAGDGPERARLVERAARLGLRNVQFLGAVPDDHLPALYRAADACVVPSVALEGFGLVVFEALACGTPVIVTDVGGLPEAVAGLADDLVVRAGDHAALGDRISRALDGRTPLPTRARCRSHAEAHPWATVADRHRELYLEAISPTVRPRVVFLDHCARMSGGEIAMLRTVRGLRDVDLHVVTFEDGPLLVELGAAGVTSEVLAMPDRTLDLRRAQIGARFPWRAALDTVVQTARVARRLRQLRPDVVHTNSLKASVIGAVAARIARVPCVWHVRDRIDADAMPRPAVSFVRALVRRVPTVVVANSAASLTSLRLPERGGPRRAVLPDPLPDEFFASAPHRTASAGLVVGIVGRLAPWKGQDVFLDAFARAFPDGEPGGPRARIVGDALFGEDDLRDELRARAERLGIADRVTFRGFRADIPGELAALDVLVHASVQAEPFGQVIVEGMAAGLAVVATGAGGPAEIIDDGVDGLLVPPGDVGALADALRLLAADGERRATLGHKAQVSAGRYRTSVVVPQFAALYDDVRAAGRGRR